MSEATETAAYAAEDALNRAVDIVCAYVSNNVVPANDLSALIGTLHATLTGFSGGTASADAEPEVTKPTPAEIRKSIRPDGLVSFIDGKSYNTLKRHLTKHGIEPHSYRERYGRLPDDLGELLGPALSAREEPRSRPAGSGGRDY